MNAGFVSVPVVPVFAGMSKAFAEKLEKPAKQAGERAGKAMSEPLDGAVANLERQVKASTGKLDQLDRAHEKSVSKRAQQQDKLEASTLRLEDAEQKYKEAVAKGDSGLKELARVKDEKAKVKKATDDLRQSEIDVTVAERKHKDQLDDLNRTTEKYEKAQKGLNAEVGKSKGAFSELKGAFKGIGDQVSTMPGPIGSIGDTLSSFKAGPAAGVMAVGAALTTAAGAFGKWNEDLVQSRVTMQNQFGLSADAARDMQGEVADALGSGLGSYEETSMAVQQISQVWGDEVAHMGGQTAAQLSDDFMAFNTTFARSAEETASAVDVMLNSGMVGSAQEGLDLLTAGMQEVPAAMQDEVFDALNEYSKNFSNLGISGSEAMSMLVKASENGQYAIDKTGDAIKEFSVLAIDPAKAEAFESIGLNAETMATAVAGGGDSASQALQDVAQSLLDIEDPGKRAGLAVELFGAPIEDLGVDQIPAFLESLTSGGEGMGDFAGSAQEMADNTTKTLSGMFASAKGHVQGWAIDATLALNEWAGDAVSAIVNSPIVDAVGSVFGEAKDLVSGAWGDIVSVFNGGGWDEVPALEKLLGTDNTDWIVQKIGSIKPAWDDLVSAFTGDGSTHGALSLFLGADRAEELVDMIARMGEQFREFKDNVVQFAQDIWAAVEPVFTWLQEFLADQLSGTLGSLWESLQSVGSAVGEVAAAVGGALWDALMGFWEIGQALWDLLSPLLIPVLKVLGGIVGGALVAAFMLLVGAVRLVSEVIEIAAGVISWVADNVLAPLIGLVGTVARMFSDVLAGAVQSFREHFSEAISAVGSIWDGVVTLLGIGKDFIVATVFGGLGAGLDVLKGSFGTAVEAIGKIWDGLREAAAAPVRFVVDTVWNNGLLKAVEAITKFIPGLNAPDPVEIGFRRGGILPGYSRMADGDDQLVPMRRGEGVLVSEGLRDERSRGLFLAANEEAKRGKSFATFMSDYVAGYAGGGIIGSMQSVMREFYPELSLTSGHRPGDSGYHGSGQAADFSNTGSGMPSTPAMQAASAFMYTNYGDQLEQLIHHPARNIGEGRDVGDGFGFYGSGTMYGHTDHIHLAALRALVDPSGVVQMMPYDGSGGGFNPLAIAKGLWDGVINKISPFKEDGGWFSEIPGAFLSHVGETMWNFVSGKIGSGSYDGAGGAIGDAESWREMAMAAMRRNGFNADDPAQVNAMLAQIMSESGGNPSVVQQVQDVNSGGNEAVGLLQVIPGTFAANRDPSLPNDRTDPWANMNAALRYYKGRYGSDLTTMWGHGHGYAAGGIIDLPELFTRDLGGIVPSGALVRNTSGRDELMLPPETTALLNQFFREFPEVARALESSVVALEGAAEWLAEAADSTSVGGVTARQSARRVLGLGLDLPGSGVMAMFLDAEESLLASRARHLGHLDNLAEKEQALEEARKALADMESSEGGLSKDEQSKLDDAIKARDEAQANLEQAESEEKRAEATEKLADSEEKLTRVREDLDANAEKSAEKHAEEIVKANDAVVKAEQDLVEAKKQQVQDLDHMVLVSQGSIMGMIPQVEGLASQIIGMGVPAAAVNQGLGQVIGSLTSVAGLAGPAGVTLGMAFDVAKIGIELVQAIEGIIKDIVQTITVYRVARQQVFSEYAANVGQINALVREQKSRVVDLAAAWVDATAAMAAAVRAVTTASGGVFKAALEGAQGIADIQKKIRDTQASSGGGGGSSSGSAPWDMGLLYDSYSNQLTATPRVKKSSSGASTQDVVNGLDEIAALQYDLLAAEINAQVLMKQAALDLLNAQYEQSQAQVALVRLEEDLGRQIRHLNSLQEIQVQFSMNEQQAILAQAYADMAVKVAEAEATNMDLGNRIGAFLDFDGDGKVFGLFTNVGSSSIQAAEAQKEAARAQMEAIAKMAESYGGLPDMGDLEGSIDRAARLIAAGEDAAADMAIWGSELGNPARMLQITELETTLRNVDENQLGLARTIEDLRAYWEHLQEVMPLEEEIFSLENERDAHTAQAEALRASSVEVRAAAEALRDFHLQAVNAKPQETTLTVVIPSRGQMVDPDDLDAAFSQLGTQIQGLNFRVQRVEDSGKAGAGAALATRK